MNRTAAIASILFAGITLAPLGGHVIADEQPLFGYSAESSHIERQWEEKLRAIPSPDSLRAYMQRLSAHPHHVGSPYDKANAEWIAEKFKEIGLDTHIEQFFVLFGSRRQSPGAVASAGPHLQSASRAASHLQRLLHRRRRDRSSGLRQLRHPRRLRAARSLGRICQGKDCHRALLSFLARYQAQSRGRARGRRLPDILRSA